MQSTSALLQRISESATLAMARKSRELAASGVSVISLSLGEPDFNTPEFIKDAAKAAIDQDFSHYPPVNGYDDLRTAIKEKFKRDNNLDYEINQIVVSTGAKQSIINVILSLLNEEDEVVLPAPYWVSYVQMVQLAGAKTVVIPTTIESDFKISAADLEKAITPQTRMFIFSSPCNPSGSVYEQEELAALAEVFAKHPNIIVVSDEIYEHINFTGKHQSIGSFANIAQQTITVNGVSKSFAMTGWRIGYLGAPEWIAKACTKLQGQFTSGPNTIAQKAAEAALKAPSSVTYSMRDAFRQRRDMMVELLKEIPGIHVNVPKGAFYLFPDVSSYFGKKYGDKTISNGPELCEYLLEVAHVALVDGDAFGSPECIRLSYAASEDDLKNAVERIKKALAQLK